MADEPYVWKGPVGPRPVFKIKGVYTTKWPIVIPEDDGYPRAMEGEWPNKVEYLTPSIVEVWFKVDNAFDSAIMDLEQWQKINTLHVEMRECLPRLKDGTLIQRLGACVEDPLTKKPVFVCLDQLFHDHKRLFRQKQHVNKNPLDFRASNQKRDRSPDREKRALSKHRTKVPVERGCGVEGVWRGFDMPTRQCYYLPTWREKRVVMFGTQKHWALNNEHNDAIKLAQVEYKAIIERLVNAELEAQDKMALIPKKTGNAMTRNPNTLKRVKIVPPPWDFLGKYEETESWVSRWPNPMRLVGDTVVEMALDKAKKQTMIVDLDVWQEKICPERWIVGKVAHPRPDGSNTIKIYRWKEIPGETELLQELLTDLISDHHSSYAPARHLNGNLFDNRLENLARGLKENSTFDRKIKSGFYGIRKVDGPGVKRPYVCGKWMDMHGLYEIGTPFEFIPGDEESELSAIIRALKERDDRMPAIRKIRAKTSHGHRSTKEEVL